MRKEYYPQETQSLTYKPYIAPITTSHSQDYNEDPRVVI